MITAEAWQKKEVRQVGEVVTGTTPSTKKPEYYGHEYKLISPADLDNGKYVITAHRMLSALGLEQCRVLPKNTVLVGCIGNVGKIGMVADEHAATNQQINAVICNAEHDPHFVYYSLHYNRQRLEDAAVKTTVPILNKSNFGRFDLVVPPFSEQQRIAYVLSMVQTAIEQQATLITLTRELKSALMRKLFTEGLRGEKQKETDIGLVPESWEVRRLQETVEYIDYGFSAPIPKTGPENGIKIVSTADINREGEMLYWKIRRTIAPETTVRRLTLLDGDVLFNWRNSAELIGKTAIFEQQPEPHIFASFVLRIRCDEMKTHNYFLKHLLNHYRKQEVFVKLSRRAVNQANYNRNEIFELKIPFPQYGEQCEIAEVIEAVDSKIHTHESKKNLLEELFRTLLHQLMTGQTRVNDIDLPSLS